MTITGTYRTIITMVVWRMCCCCAAVLGDAIGFYMSALTYKGQVCIHVDINVIIIFTDMMVRSYL